MTKAKTVDGERTRDEVVQAVLKLADGYLAKQPADTLISDGNGVMTWGELRQHVHGAYLLMERGR
jgi:hypothetical protein